MGAVGALRNALATLRSVVAAYRLQGCQIAVGKAILRRTKMPGLCAEKIICVGSCWFSHVSLMVKGSEMADFGPAEWQHPGPRK